MKRATPHFQNGRMWHNDGNRLFFYLFHSHRHMHSIVRGWFVCHLFPIAWEFVRTLALPLSFSDFCMPASQPVELLLFVSFDFVPYGHDKEAANSTVRLLCLPSNDFQHYVCMRYTMCDTVCIQSIAVNGILINNWNVEANFLVAFSLSLSLVC